MSLDQKHDVILPLWSILCPGCPKAIVELTQESLARSFERHIRKCKKLLNSRQVLKWKDQGILDEMLTVMIRDMLTDHVQKIAYECSVSVESGGIKNVLEES